VVDGVSLIRKRKMTLFMNGLQCIYQNGYGVLNIIVYQDKKSVVWQVKWLHKIVCLGEQLYKILCHDE